MQTLRIYAGVTLMTMAVCLQAQSPETAPRLLAAARAALGGEARLSAIRSFVIRGTVIQHEGSHTRTYGTFEIWCELPDRFVRRQDRVTAGTPSIDFAGFHPRRHDTFLGFNGRRLVYEAIDSDPPRNWLAAPGSTEQRLTSAQLDFVDVTLGLFAASFVGAPVQFAEIPTERDALTVTSGNVSRRLDFDPQSHLPARVGNTWYADYREIDAVKVPFRFEERHTARDGSERVSRVWQVKDFLPNAAISARIFQPR